MAKTERDLMKRKMDQATDHIQKSAEIIQQVAEIYAGEHPEIVEEYKTTYAFLLQAKVLVELLRRTY